MPCIAVARPRLPDELKRSPFRATVSPQDRRWLEAHVGDGLRWPSTTALLGDAIVLLRELEIQEGNVRQELLRRHLQNLRQMDELAQALDERARAASPKPASGTPSAAEPLASMGSRPPVVPDVQTPVPISAPAVDRSEKGFGRRVEVESPREAPPPTRNWDVGWMTSEERKEHEQLYRDAVAHRAWQTASEMAALLGQFDQERRLIYDGPRGKIYQQGRQRVHEGPPDAGPTAKPESRLVGRV